MPARAEFQLDSCEQYFFKHSQLAAPSKDVPERALELAPRRVLDKAVSKQNEIYKLAFEEVELPFCLKTPTSVVPVVFLKWK